MGLFSDIFGSDTDTDSEQVQEIDITETLDAKRDITERQQSTTERAAAEQTAQQQQQTSERRTLDTQTEAIFRTLIEGLAPTVGTGTGAASGEALTASRALTGRAAGAEEAIRADTKAVIAERERQGINEIERIITQAATGAGSTMNTIVADLGTRASSDLQSQLAAIEGQLGIEARGAETTERIAGLEGLLRSAQTGAGVDQSTVGQIAQLGGVLRGATEEITTTGEVTGERTQQEAETSEALRTLVELIDQTTRRTGTIKTTGSTSASTSPGLLDILGVALPALISSE